MFCELQEHRPMGTKGSSLDLRQTFSDHGTISCAASFSRSWAALVDILTVNASRRNGGLDHGFVESRTNGQSNDRQFPVPLYSQSLLPPEFNVLTGAFFSATNTRYMPIA